MVLNLFCIRSVDAWAEEFGKELYEMAKTMTKVKEIKDVSIFDMQRTCVTTQANKAS